MTATFYVGDAVTVMNTLPEKSVDLILTSPPFLALRSYLPQDHPDKALEGGSQSTPGAYIDWLLDVVEACARVLAPHGSLCFELGDTYSGNNESGWDRTAPEFDRPGRLAATLDGSHTGAARNLKHWPLAKSLSLIPETFRWAMVYGHNPHTGRRTEPWRLRNVIRWVRPNPPVGALGDKFRPATSELMVFCKAKDRFFDLDAVRTEPQPGTYGIEGTGKDRSGNGFRGVTQGPTHYPRTDSHPAGAPPLDWWNIPLLDGDEETRYGPTPPKEHAPRIMGPAGKASLTKGNTTEIGERMYNNPIGSPPLDWWNIPPGGYPGAHYAVWPPELLVKPIKAMCPEKVCRRCGEASRPIREHLGRERFRQAPTPAEFAGYMRQAMDASDLSIDDIATHLGVTRQMVQFYRTEAEAQVPSLERWQQLTEILHFPRHLIESMEIVDKEYETWDQADRSIPERLYKKSDGPPKVVPTGWTDCSHDDYRPGLVLDPFAGSGTTLAVATGHGRDAIGIDLDSRNYDLALERVGPLILQLGNVTPPT